MKLNTWHKVDPKFKLSYPFKGFLFGVLVVQVIAWPTYLILLSLSNWTLVVDPSSVLIGTLVLAIALIIPAIVAGLQKYANYKYMLGDKAIRISTGWLTKNYVAIPYNKIQSVIIDKGIFDRFLGLAAIGVVTAGKPRSTYMKLGATDTAMNIISLDQKVAEELLETLNSFAKKGVAK